MKGASSIKNPLESFRSAFMADRFFIFMHRQLISILTIAGSDCSGGAGIQADLRAASTRSVYASTAITSVTVQNSRGVTETFVMSPDMVEKQMMSVFEDTNPNAIKIGMLGSLENGKTVVEFIKKYGAGIPVVIDPVMKATSGGDLVEYNSAMKTFYMSELFPLATVVTPNLEEIRFFVPEDDITYKEIAASFLNNCSCHAVILKGGHSEEDLITDLLAFTDYSGHISFREVTTSRMKCNNLHGTGCVYSSIIASEIAKGKPLTEAFQITSFLMKSFIAESSGYRLGKSEYGPLNLFNYQTL